MTNHIYLYGQVGDEKNGVTLAKTRAQIDPKASEYIVHVISIGGDVFEGYGIYNTFKNLKATTGKKITFQIEGLCASIMTLIVAAGDEIIMNRTSQFMIHNPQISDLSGDATDIRNVADQLDQIKGLLIQAYKTRTGLSDQQLWDMYDKETWLTAEQATDMKFVDGWSEGIKAVASVDIKKFKSEKMDQTVLTKLTNSVKSLFMQLKKVSNMVEVTLADGTLVTIMSEPGEDLTGKSITTADGTALAPGDYDLATGEKITVDENGIITAVTAAAAPEDAAKTETETATPEDMQENEKLKNEIETLKAQLADKVKAESEAKAATNVLNTKFTALAKQVEELKKTTVGEDAPPPAGGTHRFTNKDEAEDPMTADLRIELQHRNLYPKQ